MLMANDTCLIGWSTPGTCGHSRTAPVHTGSPAGRQAGPLRKPTLQAGTPIADNAANESGCDATDAAPPPRRRPRMDSPGRLADPTG